MMPSTAWSIGASSKTMFAALPPSSSVSFLPVPATARWMSLPTLGRAGEGDLVDARMVDQRGARSPAPVTMLTTPGRQLRLPADVGEEERGERRRLGGLQHDGVAARERGRDLPREHEQREVPRDDLPDDAERRGAAVRERVLELVGPAGVVEEVRGRERHVDVARLLDRLAAVERLERRRTRARAPEQDARDAEEVLGALAARQLRPAVLVRVARRPTARSTSSALAVATSASAPRSRARSSRTTRRSAARPTRRR